MEFADTVGLVITTIFDLVGGACRDGGEDGRFIRAINVLHVSNAWDYSGEHWGGGAARLGGLLAGEGEGGGVGDSVGGGRSSSGAEGAVLSGGPGARGVAVFVVRRDSVLGSLGDADVAATGGNLLGAVGGVVEADATDVFVKVHGDVDSVA